MKQAMAVIGFVPQEVAERLVSGDLGSDYLDVRPERDVEDIFARVRASDVSESRVGDPSGDLVLVQLILRDEATVETIDKGQQEDGMKSFDDPVLNRVRQEATAKFILV